MAQATRAQKRAVDMCKAQTLRALHGQTPATVTSRITCTPPARNAARWAARTAGLTKLENSTQRPASASVALRNVNTLQLGQ